MQGLDLESELKQLRSREKKLLEVGLYPIDFDLYLEGKKLAVKGIARNKHDKRTLDRLKNGLAEVERAIERTQAKQHRVNLELGDRQKRKKDIF